MADPSTEILLLLALAGLTAGFVDAVVGRRRPRAAARPGARTARRRAGAGAGDQQARVVLRDLGQLGHLLPAGAPRPAHVRPADGVRVPRLDGRRAGGLEDPRGGPGADRAGGAGRRRRLRAAQARHRGDDRASLRRPPPHPRGGLRGSGDRLLRRRARAGHRLVLRLHARRPARLQLPRGVGQGADRQLGHQPGRPGDLRAAGRGALEGRPGDGPANLLGGYVGARTAVARGTRFVRVFFVLVVGAFIVTLGWQVLGDRL